MAVEENNAFNLPERMDQHGFPVVIVPAGTTWYRADRGGAVSPSEVVPAFFTQKDRLSAYKKPMPGQPNRGEDAVSTYRVKEDITLLHLTLENIPTFFHHPLCTEIHKKYLARWYTEGNDHDIPPHVHPSHIMPKNAASYHSKQVPYLMYMNRYIANIICKWGYDGWIVKPFSPPDEHGKNQKGLLQLSVVHGIVPYAPEIMVCRWSTMMERVESGGRRCHTRRGRKRARTRKTRSYAK